MSDTPHPDPLDEQASDLFDAGADAPGDEPELGARLDEFRALREALADVPPAPDAQRTGAIAAALALFDELAAEAASTTEDAAAPTDGPADAGDSAVVTPLRPSAPPTPAGAGAPGRRRRAGALLGVAATIVLVVGGVALVSRNSGKAQVDSASSGALDGGGGFAAAKDASDEAPATEAAVSGDATAGGSDTTAAAAAATTAAASTSVRAASPTPGATTTAAPSGGLTNPAAADTTSTTDGRDVTTTTAFAPSTTSPPTTTSTNVDAGALPYLGELTKVDDLAAALRPLPPVDTADAGAPIRAQLAAGVCDLRPYGTPLAVLRWNGRDSVLMRSADAPIVQLIPLDGCNPIVQLDAPS